MNFVAPEEVRWIVTTFRTRRKELARTRPLFPSEHSSDESAP